MKLSPMRLAQGAALVVTALTVLQACTVVVDEPGPGPGPGPQFCTREYDPVCARRDGERRTFSNRCVAEQAGWRVTRRGECRDDGDGGSQQACTMEYRPVCAQRRGNLRTFSNRCSAEAEGWRVVDQGSC